MEINSHQLAPSPNLESSLPPQPAPVPDSPLPAPSRSLSPWLLLPIFLIFLGISGYLFWQNRTLQSQLTASPSPTASAIAMAPTDPTADWQTYINNEHKVSFKYPSSWDLKIENAGDNDNGQTSNTVLFLTHEKAKISMTFNLVGIGGLGMDLEGEPFELDGIKLYKYHRTYSNGNQGIGITDQLKNTLGVFKVNGITYSFALSYPSNENGSAYEIIFDQILSTFKFTQTQNLDSNITKKIGYIKSIKPNYDNYALDIDYVEWINDNNAPNGYRINNPITTTEKLYTDVPGAEPKVTLQTYTLETDGQVKNESVTFSQFLDDFQKKPEKWTNTLFWIESTNGTVTSITEQYQP
ncbi:MAG: hypothetical protein UX38_C0002G0098 [Microgenomates group bacterium GW2011_GWC1_46_16]|uniref:Uncharacterized protein n=1 Tax=Candidatus Collierbacteria bacterium RIFOXYA2_FULL_46_10 TaxID=1817726 RepID=A0A1F5F6C4_9BACT|nr:MAG: hypothetical protein UX38_C0002G0098 [Microgenomates group bacterium GW2011_GWC1_46_16]KKU43800.1 MAG: hypothetical protein UX59_C0009G0003 [Microgenomates group bacterium GW2011_GWA1_46_7]KKU45203.1 MAG: hypothetical protein UX63_C0010G0032 [Microgenomates group bacterium GW2011_GWB1_46_7]KKU62152.1 MAG: hypothetical protein UX82_C0001G0078 [Microgenomates group bacterium GW2011_GWE1_47_12]OGD75197.1 MAG: hypothetical protein A2228_02935 [Candidatus Collierbacteria bacterium RIFOXYA2_F